MIAYLLISRDSSKNMYIFRLPFLSKLWGNKTIAEPMFDLSGIDQRLNVIWNSCFLFINDKLLISRNCMQKHHLLVAFPHKNPRPAFRLFILLQRWLFCFFFFTYLPVSLVCAKTACNSCMGQGSSLGLAAE